MWWWPGGEGVGNVCTCVTSFDLYRSEADRIFQLCASTTLDLSSSLIWPR